MLLAECVQTAQLQLEYISRFRRDIDRVLSTLLLNEPEVRP